MVEEFTMECGEGLAGGLISRSASPRSNRQQHCPSYTLCHCLGCGNGMHAHLVKALIECWADVKPASQTVFKY